MYSSSLSFTATPLEWRPSLSLACPFAPCSRWEVPWSRRTGTPGQAARSRWFGTSGPDILLLQHLNSLQYR